MADGEQATSLERSLGRVEGKLDLLVSSVSDLSGAFKTLEAGRLSALETKVAGLTVRVALISASVPVVISIAFFLAEKYLLK